MPDIERTPQTETVKGAGLARGPALLAGLALSVIGLALFFKVSGAPLSTAGFPDATEPGQGLLGFQVNAWTAWLTTAAGVLLLFGATQHLAAKGMSLLVGLALGAASVIALVDGDDVLGLAAANGLTALVWGAFAAVLLFNALAPRLRHERTVRGDVDTTTRRQERVTEPPKPAFADLRGGGEGAPRSEPQTRPRGVTPEPTTRD